MGLIHAKTDFMNNTLAAQTQELAPSGESVSLVQITDCHIFAQRRARLRGFDTRASFEAVRAAAVARHGPPDLLLATGDLSQDGSAESYRYLAQQFDATGVPTFWIPGNHDSSENLDRFFTGTHIYAARRIVAGEWLILLLDSTLDGRVEGRVCDAQLDFLDASLEQFRGRHALVALHHQAVAAGSEWIDAKGLLNADEFRRRLARHDNARAVLWGHVHQESWHRFDGIEWMSTPSSCVQFAPRSREFAIGSEAPGYRHLALHGDGRLETRVHRLENLDYAVESAAEC